jgi:release factor H-coupled RctB family protein
VDWARANRALIVERFLACIGATGEPILDIGHNTLERVSHEGMDLWLHRKGAAPSGRGLVVIPGSRGTLSYLVAPKGDSIESGWSLAHGAGRRWKRSECRARLERRFSVESLTTTQLGGVVICQDRDLLYEEAPPAYKDINQVIRDLERSGLIEVVATFRPLITYKRVRR